MHTISGRRGSRTPSVVLIPKLNACAPLFSSSENRAVYSRPCRPIARRFVNHNNTIPMKKTFIFPRRAGIIYKKPSLSKD